MFFLESMIETNAVQTIAKIRRTGYTELFDLQFAYRNYRWFVNGGRVSAKTAIQLIHDCYQALYGLVGMVKSRDLVALSFVEAIQRDPIALDLYLNP